jgi:hypothetical protein
MGDKTKKMAGSRSEMVARMKADEGLLEKIKELNKTTETPPETPEA